MSTTGVSRSLTGSATFDGNSPVTTAQDDYIVGKDVSLSYRRDEETSDLEVLSHVDFAISRTRVAAIIGPSGCGKTTLLNCIGGLLSIKGELTIDGKRPDEARRERYFGLVPQEPTLFEWKTVFANIALPFSIFGGSISSREIEERVRRMIQLVGLERFERVYPHALSGGMKQRVSLARALCFEPPILLMDEPFGALDALTREQMNFEVLRIWSELKNTMILVTHDVTEAVLLADRVFCMTRSPARIKEVVEIEIPRPRRREVIDSPMLHEYVRYLRALLQS